MFDEKKLKEIEEKKKIYDEKLKEVLSKTPERRKEFTTISGRKVERYYTPLDIKNLDYDKDIGLPGSYPYTRGIHPTMYRGQL
ncbi:MAG: methylmalonyl-CoA mutase family protein, partial [Candidatus Thermoplasmatota archaeon]